ncbi:hemicentin-1-like [Scyliorhinus torazame]|uniref:hemicentin-1-like n=1 Tax=Scyliorhinus torazame TaxID=75743 RepID=UPI003B5BB973
MEGSSAWLHCTLWGEPAVSLRWVRNGEEISTSSSGNVKQIFHNITAEDDGEYWCVADYNNDTMNSSTQISVQYKPSIIAGPICTNSENGTNCTCRIRANPPANITWRLNGRILPGFRSDVEITSWAVNRSLVESSLRLILPTGTRKVISCKAANKHGDSISKFQLHSEGMQFWEILLRIGAAAAVLVVLLAVVMKTTSSHHVQLHICNGCVSFITGAEKKQEAQEVTIKDHERAATDQSDWIVALEKEVARRVAMQGNLSGKVEEQENRSMRQNLRIVGLPEGTKGRDPTNYVAQMLGNLTPKYWPRVAKSLENCVSEVVAEEQMGFVKGNIRSLHEKWLKMDSGNSATLTIYDSKNPDVQHNNSRGGVKFTGNLEKGQCSLLIKDIGKSDEGTYQFIVKINYMASIAGERAYRREVRLSVTGGIVKPTVNSSAVAMEGSSAWLHCTLWGEPAVSLRWVRNGEEISTSSSGDLKQIFHNITAEDDGEYWCVADYNNDTMNSSTQISVQYKPRIIMGPICTTSENGTNCTCRIRANPAAIITWGLNGMEITSWAVNRTLVESSLRLFLPTGTENRISCKAANRHGDCVRKFQLHTEDKPRIIAGPICTNSENGANCTCRIRANSPANITWRLNGRILPGFRSDVEITSWAVNRSLVESSLRLILPTGTRKVISCKAANKHGDSISKFQLHTEENFLWIIVIVVGTIDAVIILIMIVAKVQRYV